MTLESSFLALLRSSSIARDAATSCGDELTLEVVECAQPMAVRGGRGRVGESSVEKKRRAASRLGTGEHGWPSSID